MRGSQRPSKRNNLEQKSPYLLDETNIESSLESSEDLSSSLEDSTDLEPNIEAASSTSKGPGRPSDSFGLKRALLKEFCSDPKHPSRTQLELISAYCKLAEQQKRELSPRDLTSLILNMKSILKLLMDIRDSLPPSSPTTDLDRVSLKELEEKNHEFNHLLARPHIHKNGTVQEVDIETLPKPLTSCHVDELPISLPLETPETPKETPRRRLIL